MVVDPLAQQIVVEVLLGVQLLVEHKPLLGVIGVVFRKVGVGVEVRSGAGVCRLIVGDTCGTLLAGLQGADIGILEVFQELLIVRKSVVLHKGGLGILIAVVVGQIGHGIEPLQYAGVLRCVGGHFVPLGLLQVQLVQVLAEHDVPERRNYLYDR